MIIRIEVSDDDLIRLLNWAGNGVRGNTEWEDFEECVKRLLASAHLDARDINLLLVGAGIQHEET